MLVIILLLFSFIFISFLRKKSVLFVLSSYFFLLFLEQLNANFLHFLSIACIIFFLNVLFVPFSFFRILFLNNFLIFYIVFNSSNISFVYSAFFLNFYYSDFLFLILFVLWFLFFYYRCNFIVINIIFFIFFTLLARNMNLQFMFHFYLLIKFCEFFYFFNKIHYNYKLSLSVISFIYYDCLIFFLFLKL